MVESNASGEQSQPQWSIRLVALQSLSMPQTQSYAFYLEAVSAKFA